MTDTLSGIVWILYIVLGYWSVGQTIMQTKLLLVRWEHCGSKDLYLVLCLAGY